MRVTVRQSLWVITISVLRIRFNIDVESTVECRSVKVKLHVRVYTEYIQYWCEGATGTLVLCYNYTVLNRSRI